jgi:hypothetical protein
VLAAADDVLSPQDDGRLSELLAMQRESALNAQDRNELLQLMHSYQERLVRKAAAIREAVARKLRGPLES